MKRTLAGVLALLALASPTWAQVGGDKGKDQPKGQNAALEQKLIDMERQLWEAWKNKNGEPFRQNLTDQTVTVSVGGVERGKEKAADEISKGTCDVRSYSLTDTKVDWLNKDMALLTYKADQDATCGGQKVPGTVYASSIWAKKGGKWLAAFHQETPAATQPSQQAPAQ